MSTEAEIKTSIGELRTAVVNLTYRVDSLRTEVALMQRKNAEQPAALMEQVLQERTE